MDKDRKNSCWIRVTEEVYSDEWDNLSAAEQEEKSKIAILYYLKSIRLLHKFVNYNSTVPD